MILIFRDTVGEYDPDDYDVVAEYDPDSGQWVEDEHGFAEFYPEGTDPEAIMRQLDGPTYIAVDTEGSEAEKRAPRSRIGPPHADTIADFEVVEDEGEGPDEEEEGRAARRAWEETREKADRLYVDSVDDVPDGEIAHVTVDEEGDPDKVWYEP